MKRIGLPVLVILLIPTILACGLTNTVTDAVTGGDTFKPAAQLWSDVPSMPGLSPSELEDLPLPVKLLVRTVLGNLGRFNAEGEDQTTGNIDWISYDYSGTPSDVSNFYTPEAMAGNGWEAGGTGCANDIDSGPAGSAVFCSFEKTEAGTQKMLAVIATQEAATKPTSVFFLRLEAPEGTQ